MIRSALLLAALSAALPAAAQGWYAGIAGGEANTDR